MTLQVRKLPTIARHSHVRNLAPIFVTLSIALLIGHNASAQTPCGPIPLSVCHQPPKCIGDGWVTGAVLTNGSSCSTSTIQSGQCEAGTCEPLPPAHSGSVAPAYYLVTILYDVPGLKSKASYTDGSSAGASTSVASMFGSGIKVGITGTIIATTDYQVTTQNSQSFQVTKTLKSELDISGVSDIIQHGDDLFYLWLNPVINYSQAQSPGMPVNISLGTVGNAPMTVISLTANELTGQEPIAAWKKPYLLNFTPSDFVQIATADPFLTSGYQLDPSRYIPITQLQLDGPDNPGDPPPGQGTSVDDSQVNCAEDSTSVELGVDFGSSGPDFFGIGEKPTVVDSMSWKNTSSVGDCNGSNQTAMVDLATTTVGYHDVIDVYEDSIFHSFAYVSESQGAGYPADIADISGTVKDGTGKPLPNQSIVVKFANGKTRTLFSNAQGNYRIFQVPAGPLQVKAGAFATTATFTPGQRITNQLIQMVAVGPIFLSGVAIKTANGHFLTAVGGGGLGGANTALQTDRTKASTWETFLLSPMNISTGTFTLQTLSGNFVTAVNGGGVGGPNTSQAPIHTDAVSAGPWEKFTIVGPVACASQQQTAAMVQHVGMGGPFCVELMTADGHYVTAFNGGGVAGPDDVIHTNATQAGPSEQFQWVKQ